MCLNLFQSEFANIFVSKVQTAKLRFFFALVNLLVRVLILINLVIRKFQWNPVSEFHSHLTGFLELFLTARVRYRAITVVLLRFAFFIRN